MRKRVAHRSAGFNLVHLLVLLAVVGVALAFLLPVIQRAREAANLALCKDHLRRIGTVLTEYARLNAGMLPVSSTIENPHADLLQSIAASHCLSDPRDFFCPSRQQPELRFSDENARRGDIGYFYYSAFSAGQDPALSKFLRAGISWPHELNPRMDPRSWIMSDVWYSGQPTAHSGYRKGLNYLMLDGSVAFISESPRQAFH